MIDYFLLPTAQLDQSFTESIIPLLLSLKVSDEWLKNGPVKLLRIVDGTVEEIEYTYNEDTQTITFTIDTLGLFVVSYDTPNYVLWGSVGFGILALLGGLWFGINKFWCLKFFWFILGKNDDEDDEEEKTMKTQN